MFFVLLFSSFSILILIHFCRMSQVVSVQCISIETESSWADGRWNIMSWLLPKNKGVWMKGKRLSQRQETNQWGGNTQRGITLHADFALVFILSHTHYSQKGLKKLCPLKHYRGSRGLHTFKRWLLISLNTDSAQHFTHFWWKYMTLFILNYIPWYIKCYSNGPSPQQR